MEKMRKILLVVLLLFLAIKLPAWGQFNVGTSIQPFKYYYLPYTSTTVVKSGRGFLHNITMEGGLSGFVTLYDNGLISAVSASGVNVGFASGPVIGNFDATNSLFTYTYDIGFSSGLTVQTTASTKMTISYL